MGLFILGVEIDFYVFYFGFFECEIGVGCVCVFEIVECNWCIWYDVDGFVFC